MRNNFVTNQFNKTKLRKGVRWRKLNTTWLNTILTIVNGKQGETTQQKKKNAVKYKSEQTFLKILSEKYSTNSSD